MTSLHTTGILRDALAEELRLPPEEAAALAERLARRLDGGRAEARSVRRAEAALAARLLSADAPAQRSDLLADAADLGYRLEHPMAVLVASLETSYNHCLNMDLGYESATNESMQSILDTLKSHPFLNRQDLVAFVRSDCLVILKAIDELSDVPRLYQMQARLAAAVSDVLKTYRIFRYYIAAGGIAERLEEAHRSFEEALDYTGFARRMDLDHPVVTQDDVLYYVLVSRLPAERRVNTVEPRVQALLRQKRETVEELGRCFDAFLENGFSIANTAQAVYLHRNTVKKRLEKLRRLTGFDPLGDFRDLLMNRLILQQYALESRGR